MVDKFFIIVCIIIKEFTSYHLFYFKHNATQTYAVSKITREKFGKKFQCGKVSFLVQIIIVLHFQVMYYKGLPIWASLKNCCIIFDHSIVEIGSNAVQGLLGPKIKKGTKIMFLDRQS